MAGTATVTTLPLGGNQTRYAIAWTSTAGGAVSGNAFSVCRGALLQIKFVPGSGGNQPTNGYNVTLVDTDSIDVLGGAGQNLSNSAGSVKSALLGDVYYHDAQQQLDLVVSGAGNSKSGTVYLLVQG